MFLGCFAVSEFLFHLSILTALQDLPGGEDAVVMCSRGGCRERGAKETTCLTVTAAQSGLFLIMFSGRVM